MQQKKHFASQEVRTLDARGTLHVDMKLSTLKLVLRERGTSPVRSSAWKHIRVLPEKEVHASARAHDDDGTLFRRFQHNIMPEDHLDEAQVAGAAAAADNDCGGCGGRPRSMPARG